MLTRRSEQLCALHSMFQHNSQSCKNSHFYLSGKSLGVSESKLHVLEKKIVLSELKLRRFFTAEKNKNSTASVPE